MPGLQDSILDSSAQQPDSDETAAVSQLPDKEPVAPAGPKSAPPSPKEMDDIITHIQSYKRALAPVIDTKPLVDLENHAYELYNQRASRSDWLQLADTVGRSLARIGMAQAGAKAGVDTSKVELGPGQDFGKGEERASRDLDRALSMTSRLREELPRQQALAQEMLDKNTEFEMGKSREALGEAKTKYTEAYTSERFTDRQKDLDNRQASRINAMLDKVQAQQLDAATKRQVGQLRSEFRDIEKTQLPGLRDKETAALNLGSMLSAEKDISPKHRDELTTKMGAVASKAGVTVDEAMKAMNEAKTEALASPQGKLVEKHWYGDKETADPKVVEKIFTDKILKEAKGMHADLSARKDEIMKQLQDLTMAGPKQPGAKPAPMYNIVAPPSAQSSPAAASQDQQALGWARANPKDPRAAAILKKLGQ